MSLKIQITRPLPEEYAPFYRGYIEQVEGRDALAALREALDNTTRFLQSIPTEKWNFRYAPGKWSLKESVIHMLDTERVFSYRALRISRNDQKPLQGFDQDDYIPFYHAETRSPESVIEEYRSIRLATLSLFQNLDEAAVNRMGTASGKGVSVRALAYMIAGHEQHHMRLAREKYLA